MNLFESFNFFRKKTPLRVDHHPQWYAHNLSRNVVLDVYLPPDFRKGHDIKYPLLLVNDGQDLPRMDFFHILENLYKKKDIPHIIVAAVHANHDRIREYGTARQPDYKGRGDLAPNYKRFIVNELLPYLDSEYNISPEAEDRYFAGFSLGALSALDIVWSEPELFGGAGVFSGALWWRWDDVHNDDPDAHRIMHDIIRTDNRWHRPNEQFFWFQAGTRDEDEDRNNNGVIDAIDDTLACIDAILERGYSTEQVRYLEIKEGTHDPETWGKAMPDFLNWAFNNVGGGMEYGGG